MVYKWCVVPKCTNTSIKTPHKLFVSVPTNPDRRKLWLKLARRDTNSILSHSNVFMCEDHFDMEKDTTNYMQYKMGFSQRILLADEAMPTKFYCQEDCKRQLSNARSSREVFPKKQRIAFIPESLQSQTASQSNAESLQIDDNVIQEVIDPEDGAQLIASEELSDASLYSDERHSALLDATLYCDERRSALLDASGKQVGQIHEGFQCDLCKADISGFRYVCLQCADYDLCPACEARGAHAQHYALRVPGPRPYAEVQRMVERIRRELMSSQQLSILVDDETEADEATAGDSIKMEVKVEVEEPIDPGPDPLLETAPFMLEDRPVPVIVEAVDCSVAEPVLDIKTEAERAATRTNVVSHTGENNVSKLPKKKATLNTSDDVRKVQSDIIATPLSVAHDEETVKAHGDSIWFEVYTHKSPNTAERKSQIMSLCNSKETMSSTPNKKSSASGKKR